MEERPSSKRYTSTQPSVLTTKVEPRASFREACHQRRAWKPSSGQRRPSLWMGWSGFMVKMLTCWRGKLAKEREEGFGVVRFGDEPLLAVDEAGDAALF